jgi:hypothetical protein
MPSCLAKCSEAESHVLSREVVSVFRTSKCDNMVQGSKRCHVPVDLRYPKRSVRRSGFGGMAQQGYQQSICLFMHSSLDPRSHGWFVWSYNSRRPQLGISLTMVSNFLTTKHKTQIWKTRKRRNHTCNLKED